MSEKTNQNKRPTHALFTVVGEGDKARWIRIGAAWPNKDGKGANLIFDALPISGRAVLREITEQDITGDDDNSTSQGGGQ